MLSALDGMAGYSKSWGSEITTLRVQSRSLARYSVISRTAPDIWLVPCGLSRDQSRSIRSGPPNLIPSNSAVFGGPRHPSQTLIFYRGCGMYDCVDSAEYFVERVILQHSARLSIC